MKKKKKSNIPRHKRMKRASRLQAAKSWIPKYEGKNIVRGYSKHFAVDKLCAIKELQILGIIIEPEYIKQIKNSLKGEERARQLRKLQKEQDKDFIMDNDSDETFCFIAGYTSGGVPFGVTWEEMEMDMETNVDERETDIENYEFNVLIDGDDDIPF